MLAISDFMINVQKNSIQFIQALYIYIPVHYMAEDIIHLQHLEIEV